MAEKIKETRLSIRGECIQLRTDIESEHLKNLAAHVTDTMDRLDPKEILPLNKLSLLTSLTLAEEVHEIRKEASDKNERFVERIKHLGGILDEALNSL